MATKLTAPEIGPIGEKHVMTALKAKGFGCHRNTQLSDGGDIEAVQRDREGKILASLHVQVKTAVQ